MFHLSKDSIDIVGVEKSTQQINTMLVSYKIQTNMHMRCHHNVVIGHQRPEKVR